MDGLQELEFGGRKADLHYSLPKEGDQEKNQGSIDIELVQSSGPLDETELLEFMSQYGEIRGIRGVPGNNQ
jgi:hypothetical protein